MGNDGAALDVAPTLDAPSTLMSEVAVLNAQNTQAETSIDFDTLREQFLSTRPALRALANRAQAQNTQLSTAQATVAGKQL
jgi:hypothetical protein